MPELDDVKKAEEASASATEAQPDAAATAETTAAEAVEDVNAEQEPAQEEDILAAVKEVIGPSEEDLLREAAKAGESEASADEAAKAADGQEPDPEKAKGEDDDTVSDPGEDEEVRLTDEEMEKIGDRARKRIHALHREASTYREQAEEYEEAAEQYGQISSFMEENSLSEDEVADLLIVGANLKSNPQAAFERIKPIYDQLSEIVGTTLPADLQQEVTDGLISEERASEIAQLRGQTAVTSQRLETVETRQAEQSEEEKAAEHGTNIARAVASFEAQVAETDPDYETIKAPLVEEMVGARIAREGRMPDDPEEAIAWTKDAIDRATKIMAPMRRAAPVVPETTPIPETAKIPNVTAEPETALDAARLGLRLAQEQQQNL